MARRGGAALQLGSPRPGPTSATRKLWGPGRLSICVCLSLLVNDITGGKEALSWFDYEIPPPSQVSEHLFPSWRASSVSFWDPWRCVATVGLWWLESSPTLGPIPAAWSRDTRRYHRPTYSNRHTIPADGQDPLNWATRNVSYLKLLPMSDLSQSEPQKSRAWGSVGLTCSPHELLLL